MGIGKIMSPDEIAIAGSAVLITLMYFLVGLGVAKMMAKIKNRNISIFDICMWVIVTLVFATTDDCE